MINYSFCVNWMDGEDDGRDERESWLMAFIENDAEDDEAQEGADGMEEQVCQMVEFGIE